MARARAKRLGYRVTVRAGTVSVLDGDLLIRLGDIDTVGTWLEHRAAPQYQKPGPSKVAPPEVWAPWLDLFVDELHAARRSSTGITTRLSHLVTFAWAHPGTGPLEVTRDQLIAWLGTPGWKPRYAHGIRSTMRVFFRFLYDQEHRRDNPAATLPAICLPRSMPRPCTDEAIRAAAASADPTVRLALRILVETGMRRAEVARLRPTDVEGHPADYRLRIAGKGGHTRLLPISDSLAADLLAVETAHVFPTIGGGPVTARHLGKRISECLPGEWTTHSLRHRFATAAYLASGDLRAVQELLGHTSPTTTAIYTRIADDSMRRAAAAAHMDF
jgi:integrase/recombinase XerD